LEELIKEVAAYYNITPEDLQSSYNRRVVCIRSTLYDYLHNELQISNHKLSKYFNKNRSTIVEQIKDSQGERELFKKYMFSDRALIYEVINFVNKKNPSNKMGF
jgi:chromosomal replication initiation ATPase DnaA